MDKEHKTLKVRIAGRVHMLVISRKNRQDRSVKATAAPEGIGIARTLIARIA
jgi:hypothetical protein